MGTCGLRPVGLEEGVGLLKTLGLFVTGESLLPTPFLDLSPRTLFATVSASSPSLLPSGNEREWGGTSAHGMACSGPELSSLTSLRLMEEAVQLAPESPATSPGHLAPTPQEQREAQALPEDGTLQFQSMWGNLQEAWAPFASPSFGLSLRSCPAGQGGTACGLLLSPGGPLPVCIVCVSSGAKLLTLVTRINPVT